MHLRKHTLRIEIISYCLLTISSACMLFHESIYLPSLKSSILSQLGVCALLLINHFTGWCLTLMRKVFLRESCKLCCLQMTSLTFRKFYGSSINTVLGVWSFVEELKRSFYLAWLYAPQKFNCLFKRSDISPLDIWAIFFLTRFFPICMVGLAKDWRQSVAKKRHENLTSFLC